MNRIKLVTLVLMLGSFSAEAGWFGPDNFDDCVLENMKGVSSDAAARAVVIVCSRKFPPPKPTPPKPPTAEELAETKSRERKQKLQEEYRKKRIEILQQLANDPTVSDDQLYQILKREAEVHGVYWGNITRGKAVEPR